MALSDAEKQARYRARKRGEVVEPAPFGAHHRGLESCPQGHPYDEANTFHYKGARQCKACRKMHAAKWRAANKAYAEKKNRTYYAENRESMLAASRRWDRENRERSNMLSRLKKQRRRAAGVLTDKEWQSVLDVYGRKCLACQRTDRPLTVDHVIPVSLGGTNTTENVQPLCGPCNSSKGTKTIDYRQEMPMASSRS